MAFLVTVEQLIESASPAQKKVKNQEKRPFRPSVVAKYKACLSDLQDKARQEVPIADERTLNIRFDS